VTVHGQITELLNGISFRPGCGVPAVARAVVLGDGRLVLGEPHRIIPQSADSCNTDVRQGLLIERLEATKWSHRSHCRTSPFALNYSKSRAGCRARRFERRQEVDIGCGRKI